MSNANNTSKHHSTEIQMEQLRHDLENIELMNDLGIQDSINARKELAIAKKKKLKKN